MTTKTATIVIPTFNGEAFLPRALASLAAQTYQDFDVVVVSDDGRDYSDIAHSILGDRVQHLFTPRPASGPTPARQIGIAATESQVVGFLDVDDEYAPRRLEKLVPLALKHGAATSNLARIDDATKQFLNFTCPPGAVPQNALKEKHVPWMEGPLVPVVRRDCLPAYPEMWIFEDIIFLLRVIGRAGGALPIVDDEDALYRYLIQKKSLSFGTDKDEHITKHYEAIIYQAENGGPLFEGVSSEGKQAFWHAFKLRSARDKAYTTAKAAEPELDFQTFSPRFDAEMAHMMQDVPVSLRAWAH